MGDALRHRIQQDRFESPVQEAFLNLLVAADHLRAQTERLCGELGLSASQASRDILRKFGRNAVAKVSIVQALCTYSSISLL